MSWTGPSDTPVSARIASLAPSLQPSEKRVIDTISADRAAAVECTAQELADLAQVSRTSVIRTAQTLGYDGYPQLRVALAREVALVSSDRDEAERDTSAIGVLRDSIDRFGQNLPRVTAALTEELVTDFVRALDDADRLVVVAGGLSAPLGLDAAMRLSSAGRAAEFLPDPLSQHIAAAGLQPGSACLVLSGSGATESSVAAAAAARAAGATVLAMTSFARAPLVTNADLPLVIPPVTDSFPAELLRSSRATLSLVLEAIVELLVNRRGDRGQDARERALKVVEKQLSE